MDKIWLQHYPPGVPAEINPAEYPSLLHLIGQSIHKYRDRPCFTCMDRTLTYGDLDVLAGRFAAYLQRVARLRKGDRIAIMLPNVLQYPIAILGAFRAGLTVVNVNPLYTPRELQHQLHDSGARAILILENFAHTLEAVRDDVQLDTVIVTGVGDLLGFPRSAVVNFALRHVKKQVPDYSLPGSVRFKEALNQGRYENLDPIDLGHEDIAFLQYTGGTTGVSKGAVLTHRNLVANVLQSEAWIKPSLRADEALVAITALPLYHIFALTANSLTMLKLGAHNVMIPNPRDFGGFVRELARAPLLVLRRREHVVQRAVAYPRFRQHRFQRAARKPGWRHGGAEGRGRALERSHWQRADAGVGADGDLTGRLHQSTRRRFQRLDRLADFVHGDHDS